MRETAMSRLVSSDDTDDLVSHQNRIAVGRRTLAGDKKMVWVPEGI
jgi:hypothetical protein